MAVAASASESQRIEDMLTTRVPLVEPFTIPSPYDFKHGQQTRTAVLAQPARDGLIVGRVGDEWPSLYVNAVSYRGLLAAAEFAERLGKRQHAAKLAKPRSGVAGKLAATVSQRGPG